MRTGAHAISALALMMSAAPAIAQTVTSTAAHPYCKDSALPPGAVRSALPTDPSAPCWMLLLGYGGNGQLYQHWQLVNPQAFDATNYRGFHGDNN
jgi:hypothetical protein